MPRPSSSDAHWRTLRMSCHLASSGHPWYRVARQCSGILMVVEVAEEGVHLKKPWEPGSSACYLPATILSRTMELISTEVRSQWSKFSCPANSWRTTAGAGGDMAPKALLAAMSPSKPRPPGSPEESTNLIDRIPTHPGIQQRRASADPAQGRIQGEGSGHGA